MQHWADRCDIMRDGGNVVAITAPIREIADCAHDAQSRQGETRFLDGSMLSVNILVIIPQACRLVVMLPKQDLQRN